MKHTCHWPDCPKEVPPSMWGCKAHWFALPKFLRDKIWETYVPGQETSKTPSKDYLLVAEIVQAWITKDKVRGDAAFKKYDEENRRTAEGQGSDQAPPG